MFYHDIGIDLGTANILVYVKGKGVVFRESSVVAIDQSNGQVLAVGQEAKNMIGRTPGNIMATRPIKDGVIADFDYTQSMIRYFLAKASKSKPLLARNRVVICIPSGVTTVEERAVQEAALTAGAHEAYLIEEPMAAAIGAGMDISEPAGHMILDIGGGTTEVAIISLGGIVTVKSIRVAGDKMDSGIIAYIRRNHNLIIGERTAEEIKITLGNACIDQEYSDKTMGVRGRDSISGLPRTVLISARDIHDALEDPILDIIDAIKSCLEKAPPELCADIMDRGIVLAGGGSLIHGLPDLIAQKTGIPAHLCEDPLSAVVLGTGIMLENLDKMSKILIGGKKVKK